MAVSDTDTAKTVREASFVQNVRMERDIISHMATASERAGRPMVRTPGLPGAMGVQVAFRAAEQVSQERPGIKPVVNVFVHGIGHKEAEAVLRAQSFLMALSRGESAKAAMESAGLPVAAQKPTMVELEALGDLLGDLPKLAEMLTGREP